MQIWLGNIIRYFFLLIEKEMRLNEKNENLELIIDTMNVLNDATKID